MLNRAKQSNILILQDKMDEAATWPPDVRPRWVRRFKKQCNLNLSAAQAGIIYKGALSTRAGGRASPKELAARDNTLERYKCSEARAGKRSKEMEPVQAVGPDIQEEKGKPNSKIQAARAACMKFEKEGNIKVQATYIEKLERQMSAVSHKL